MIKTFHITTAIHNSRYSYRMGVYKIKLNNPIWLTDKDEIIITETFANIVEEDKLKILAYNICGDHIHMIITCEETKLSQIIGKIKAKSGRRCNIERGITIPSKTQRRDTTRGYIPLSGKLPVCPGPSLAKASESHIKPDKIRHNPFWTQKFGKVEITSEKQLHNTIEYIQNNREKHELEANEELELLIQRIVCSYDNAF